MTSMIVVSFRAPNYSKTECYGLRINLSSAWAARDDFHLRLWTHNIFADRAGWEGRRRVLTDGVRERQSDLLTLQETMVTHGVDGEGYPT